MSRSPGTNCVVLAALAFGGCAPPAPPPTTPPAPSAQTAALQDRPVSARTINASAAAAGAGSAASQAGGDVVARVGTRPITKDQLLAPMIEAYGLNFLLHIVQLELAKQAAVQQGVKVTPDDVKQERKLTLQRMFKDSDEALRVKLKEAEEKDDAATAEKIKAELATDREGLLNQYLAQQNAQTGQSLSRAEFDLALETNAYLRRIAEASPELAKGISEDTLRKAFAAKYGEKVVVRHIQANDVLTLQRARNRIDAGENFATVAKEVSTNRHTAPLGGAITPFTMNATNVPEKFKELAFALKVGEISDVVNADNAYHLIKVEGRIEPKVVKYEDVKESLRAELHDQLLQAAVLQLRAKVQNQMMANLRIENPALKAQFDKRVEQGKRQQAEIDAAMKRDRAVTIPREGQAAPASQPAK